MFAIAGKREILDDIALASACTRLLYLVHVLEGTAVFYLSIFPLSCAAQ